MPYRIDVASGDFSFQALDGETVLEAAQRCGIMFPASCENGVCQICEGLLLQGSVTLRPDGETLRVTTDDHAHPVIFCLAEPQSDLQIAVEAAHPAHYIPPAALACQVSQITVEDSRLTLQLLLPAGKTPALQTGHHARVLMEGKETTGQITRSGNQRTISIQCAMEDHPATVALSQQLDGCRVIKIIAPWQC